MEGIITENEYFERISELFDHIKYKLEIISLTEDEYHTPAKLRTAEQNDTISRVRPLQLVDRIAAYKERNNDSYDFDNHPEDEFWIVCDVDENWSDLWIDEWNEAIRKCEELKYQYVISNPFFEIWLLLHHDNATDGDKSFAVTDSHEYEPTDHFRVRLKDLGAPLKAKKHIEKQHYTSENVRAATLRAANLHVDRADLTPHYFATTVYLLMEKLLALSEET